MPNSASQTCRDIAVTWYNRCQQDHEECRPKNRLPNPTRLIDVISHPNPFLELHPEQPNCTWAALSYCWGGDSDFVLNETTAPNLVSGHPLESFPATLRDAIVVTRDLGIRYLWIDALYIFQDSETDWEAEASRMRDIYSGAAITIVATASDSTTAGIFADRSSKMSFELPWDNTSSVVIYPILNWNERQHPMYDSPWHQRGWTFQEELLSPRMLLYRSDQMVSECTSCHMVESNPAREEYQDSSNKDFFKETNLRGGSGVIDFRFIQVGSYEHWSSIVTQFGCRKFTKDTDTLPGLSGIAQVFAITTKDVYCAGMWRSNILIELAWSRDWVSVFRSLDQRYLHFSKSTAYLAPSWSWASIKGGWVRVPRRKYYRPAINTASIIEVHTELQGANPFGRVKSGYIILEGSLFPLDEISPEEWNYRRDLKNLRTIWEIPDRSVEHHNLKSRGLVTPGKWPNLCQFVVELKGNSYDVASEFEQQHVHYENQRFAAFLLAQMKGDTGPSVGNFRGTAHLLLLESTGEREDEYRRVGILRIKDPHLFMSDVDASTNNKLPKDLPVFSREMWENHEKTFSTQTVLEYLVWMEIAKHAPTPSVIRLI